MLRFDDNREIVIPVGNNVKRINLFTLAELKYWNRVRMSGGASDFMPSHDTFLEFISHSGETMETLRFTYFERKETFREFLEKLVKMKPELVLDANLTEFLNGNDKAANLNKVTPFWLVFIIGAAIMFIIIFGIDYVFG